MTAYRAKRGGVEPLSRPILWRPWMGRLGVVFGVACVAIVPVAGWHVASHDRVIAAFVTTLLYVAGALVFSMLPAHEAGWTRWVLLRILWWPISVPWLIASWVFRWVVHGSERAE